MANGKFPKELINGRARRQSAKLYVWYQGCVEQMLVAELSSILWPQIHLDSDDFLQLASQLIKFSLDLNIAS